MKKILLICGCVLFSSVVGATHNSSVETKCQWGNIIEGNNGNKYCVSRVSFNWYTAFTWCESQGLTLQSIQEICDNGTTVWGGNIGKNTCPNFENVENLPPYGWSSTAYRSNGALYLKFHENAVDSYSRLNSHMQVAVCR